MRRITIENVTSGSLLAKTIFKENGNVLLSEGAVLNDNIINKLKNNGIIEIYINDSLSAGIEITDEINEKTRNESRMIMRKIMNSLAFSDEVEYEKIKQTVDKIISQLLSSKDILLNLTDIKTVDDYTYSHSISVCVISLIIGINLGYSIERLTELGIGSILHDIGKLRIPGEILKKPSQLSVEEFEQIKFHTIYGYEILKHNKDITLLSSIIALSHHERIDGTGYPLQIKGDDIHEFAKIVAAADVYDALNSDRVYRKKMKCYEAFDYITLLNSHQFDDKIINTFSKSITAFPPWYFCTA